MNHQARGLELLESVDWSHLLHAYGVASDTPRHLAALVEGDGDARQAAFDHLWSAVIHQGTPWTVTGPAALFVAEVIGDPRLAPIRCGLVRFLGAVARAVIDSVYEEEELRRHAEHEIDHYIAADDLDGLYEDEDSASSLYARSVLSCLEVAPKLVAPVRAMLDDGDPAVRAEAARAAVELRAVVPEGLENLGKRLRESAQKTSSTDELCALVLAMGEAGDNPVDHLDDPVRAVRLCAALASALAHDPRASQEILEALEHHSEAIDGWFKNKPPQFVTQPRFAVVAVACERIQPFERLAPAAVAVVRTSTLHRCNGEWGPLLAKAFPDGDGAINTDAQRDVLRALVDNAKLWDPRYGNAILFFQQAGLPYDRKACQALLRR